MSLRDKLKKNRSVAEEKNSRNTSEEVSEKKSKFFAKKTVDDTIEYVEDSGDGLVERPEKMLSSRTLTVNKNTLVSSGKKRKIKYRPVDLSKAERYQPEIDKGLTFEQVEKRFDDGYVNLKPVKQGKTYVDIILSNIFTFFNVLTFLVAAAIIVAGIKSENGLQITQLFFLVIIVANIIIGIIQEVKAKYSVNKLSIVTAPSAQVIRDGQLKTIPVDEVVLDDIVFFEAGKQICSDSILISGEIEVNEALLTGESENVRKRPGDTLYSGSYLVSGNCYARIERVGAENYVNKLTSNAKNYRKPKSELNDSIRLIIKIASIFIIPAALASFAVAHFKNGLSWNDAIIKTSGAVVGMIPAGMFLLTSMALAVSVIKLAKKQTLVQDLYCIEMLARVDVLCLDKTGTLTDGTMNVSKILKMSENEPIASETIIGSMLAATEDNNQTAIAMATRFGYNKEFKPISVLPFNSQRKYSAVTFEGGMGTYLLGAPEFIFKDINPDIMKVINENAAEGLRVLCLAHSKAEIKDKMIPVADEMICLIMLEDHIREDAYETAKWFKENDVSIKVISGDNPVTVSNVAGRVGVENADMYISLDGMSDNDIIEIADKYTVFGRVTPEQKSVLVKALKSKGHTVAMTGDGVNDILAMREADCAVAIASGSEAARNISHLVLLDSSFKSMPDIVYEGRRVVNNIQKSSSLFLMKTLMSIMLAIIFLIMGQTYPLEPNSLFFLEFFIIGLPSFFLALQPNKNRIRGHFLSNVISRAVPGGFALMMTVIAVYIYSHNISIGNAGGLSAWVGGIEKPEVFIKTMMVFALSLTGFVCLCKICEPFNYFRIVLVTAIFILMTIMFFSFRQYFGLGEISLKSSAQRAFLFFDVGISFASYFIVSIVMKILKQFNVMYD